MSSVAEVHWRNCLLRRRSTLKSLLAACLGRVETKLRMVPDILGVRFPQYRDDAIESSEDEE